MKTDQVKRQPTSSLPMPTNVESVAWAEEADRLASALWDLVGVIEADDLIPETVSYMRQAREVLQRWPDRYEVEEAKDRIWGRIQAALANGVTSDSKGENK